MQTGKSLFGFVMAVLISLGLLCSQMCSIYCDISGCSQPAALMPAVNEQESRPAHPECGHHGQGAEKAGGETNHSPAGAPAQSEGHNHSHQPLCAFHADQAGLISSGANLAHPDSYPDAVAAPSGVVATFTRLIGESAAQIPDRSPPRRVTSVLRI